jgi:hypothetical protein
MCRRILRPTAGTSRIAVHDYADVEVPLVARMYAAHAWALCPAPSACDPGQSA